MQFAVMKCTSVNNRAAKFDGEHAAAAAAAHKYARRRRNCLFCSFLVVLHIPHEQLEQSSVWLGGSRTANQQHHRPGAMRAGRVEFL